jgi:CrcB protein
MRRQAMASRLPRVALHRSAEIAARRRGAAAMTHLFHQPMLAIFAVCGGACVGALGRWSLALWLNAHGPMPLGTLAANLIGGYLVGVFVGVFEAWPQLDPTWRLALITGFLGALTTFSSFSAEVVGMLHAQRYGWALATAFAHLMGSLVLTAAGLKTVAWVIAR